MSMCAFLTGDSQSDLAGRLIKLLESNLRD